MLNQLFQRAKRVWKAYSNQITLVITFVALVIFAMRGVYYAEHQVANMDEGTYLLKGKYYLEGTYKPYQAGGPVTNKGVFSFWILGLSQLIAPGLLSGRIFALSLAMAMLLVMWILIRRFSNQTWAAGILLLFSLNGFWVSMYSRALTQAVTAALIVFSLFFLTKKSAKIWELSLGLIFCVVISLTRQNLIPFYGFAILYILWQFGIKKAWLPIAISFAIFIAINVIYWPEIYRYMWRVYVQMALQVLAPEKLSVYAQTMMDLQEGQYVVEPDYNLIQELQAIFNGVGIYLVPTLFSLFFIITAKWRLFVKSEEFKTFTFLFISNLFLAIIHVLAVIQDNNLLYSYIAYPAFYLPLGLIIIPLCFRWMGEKGNFLKVFTSVLSILIVSTGIGLFLHRTFSDRLMFLTIPRVRDMHILPGTTELWRSLENKFHFGYKNLELMLAASYGLMIGLVFVAMCVIFWLLLKKSNQGLAFTRVFILSSLIIAMVLSPHDYLAGESAATMCSDSTTQALTDMANHLKTEIQPGSLIYWEYDTPAVLLSMENIEVFPLQLNNHFYRRIGGDPEYLLANGYWNEVIAEEWLLRSDYVLLSEDSALAWEPVMNSKYPGLFDKIEITENLVPCRERSYLHVYKNLSDHP